MFAVKPRGFGFVEFEDVSDAADAIDNMNGRGMVGQRPVAWHAVG